MPAAVRQKTLQISFNERAIKRAAADPAARELKDPRAPGLVLRLHKSGERGTWYIVRHQGGPAKWHKVATWPSLNSGQMLEALPVILRRLASDSAAQVSASGWVTCGELLAWFATRLATQRTLSAGRRRSAASILKCHLVPRLGAVRLSQLDKPTLLDELIWPLQAQVKPSYLEKVWQLLNQATKAAQSVGLIEVDPLAVMTLKDFLTISRQPKAGKLKAHQVRGLLGLLGDTWSGDHAKTLLVLLMLLHGTRIGETTRSRWADFDLEGKEWVLRDQDTKTGEELVLPITPTVYSLITAYRARQLSQGYAGVWVFPGENGKPLCDRSAQSLFEQLSGGEWSSHDLRKLARTAWADLGIDWLVGEALLNHKLQGVSAAYIHTTLRAGKRDALERWHAWLLEKGLAFFLRRHDRATTGANQQSPLNRAATDLAP